MDITTENPILTTQQMQMAEQYTIDIEAIHSNTLMEKAGQAVASACQKIKLDGGRIVIIVGKGNNAGDGFVTARILREKRIAVTVIPLFPLDQLKKQANTQATLAAAAGVKIRPATHEDDLLKLKSWLKRAVLVVDAIFGIGLTRPTQGWIAQAILCINACERPILSIDIASGIHSDNGNALGTAIQATATLPIATYKWGHWLQLGRICAGDVLPPAAIGISAQTIQNMFDLYPTQSTACGLIDKETIKKAFPKRQFNAYKQASGHLWIFGGSQGYTGAPKLAAMGAQSVGTGLVSIACPTDVYPIIASSSLEVMVHPQNAVGSSTADAIVLGPGWGKKHLDQMITLLQSRSPIVIDADALNMLSENIDLEKLLRLRQTTTVLTPHPGEAARLLGISPNDIQQNRLKCVMMLVDKYQAWVILKGPQTLIISPTKRVWVNPFGSPNLAVAGTGDVLAGMVGGLLAAADKPEIVLPAAVGLHGVAGEQQGWHRAGQLESIIANHIQNFQS